MFYCFSTFMGFNDGETRVPTQKNDSVVGMTGQQKGGNTFCFGLFFE